MSNDTSAFAHGRLGHDIRIVDPYPDYEEHGVLDLFTGDAVTITGVVNYVGYSIQITPEEITLLGDDVGFGLPSGIRDPVIVETSDLHMNVGGNSQRIRWENFVDYQQTLVLFNEAEIWRSPNPFDARPNWALTSDGGQTIVQNDDMSCPAKALSSWP